MRRALFLLVLPLLVPLAAAAKGPGAGASPGPAAVTGWNYGVLAPARDARYIALRRGADTTVARVAPNAHRVIRSRVLHGRFGVPVVSLDGTTGGVSADGATLVLSSLAYGRTTRFAVLSTSTLALRRLVTLPGEFSYDAIAPDGQTIYLIQYGDATYRVRAYDVALGALVPGTIVAKGESGPMEGFAVARAEPRAGGWAYTLYGRANGAPFVHALETTHRYAVCIDLPWRVERATAEQLRLSLEGSSLVVLRPGVGRVAVIDTQSFKVRSIRTP
jgi:hypothetical protein